MRTLCTSCHQVEKWQEAVEWCTKGLGMEGEGDVGLLTALAESYLKLERPGRRQRREDPWIREQPGRTILQQVQKPRKLAERKNYYKILEVPREVDEADVKRAHEARESGTRTRTLRTGRRPRRCSTTSQRPTRC